MEPMSTLVEGLKKYNQHGYQNIIMEGDSMVIISICQKIINGTPPRKTSYGWRLSSLVQMMLKLL